MFRLLWNKTKCRGCGVCVDSCLQDCMLRHVDGTMTGGGPMCTGCGFCVDGCPEGALRLLWTDGNEQNGFLPTQENYYPEIPEFLKALMDFGRKGKLRAVMFDCVLLLPPEDRIIQQERRLLVRDHRETRRPMLYATPNLRRVAKTVRPAGAPAPPNGPGPTVVPAPACSTHGVPGCAPVDEPDNLDCWTCTHCRSEKSESEVDGSCLSGQERASDSQVARMENCPLIHARCPFLRRESHSS